ncbi:hypothetical protein J3Q64DRAFT_1735309 [Phycomyces blakesleeanus]|uniref:Uncharacterized protein n=1 Tax=Phycomyces blakesleeanus TaxID=4837 RepID=A0ABR3B2Z5_PHYBL
MSVCMSVCLYVYLSVCVFLTLYGYFLLYSSWTWHLELLFVCSLFSPILSLSCLIPHISLFAFAFASIAFFFQIAVRATILKKIY